MAVMVTVTAVVMRRYEPGPRAGVCVCVCVCVCRASFSWRGIYVVYSSLDEGVVVLGRSASER